HACGLAADVRHELHRGRAGADDRHALPGEVVRVVPAAGMEDLAAEAFETREVGDDRLVQRAGADDQRVGRVAARGRIEDPAPAGVVPARLEQLGAGSHVLRHAVALRGVLEVVLDLGAPREHAAPLRVRSERVRVERRRDVAPAAGIGVVTPGAAEAVSLLEQHEVLDAGLAQFDRGANAGEAAAHDRGAQLALPSGRGRHGTGTGGSAAGSTAVACSGAGSGLGSRCSSTTLPPRAGLKKTAWSIPRSPRLAGAANVPRRTSRCRTSFISSVAKLAPMQRRMPPPKGSQAYVSGRESRNRSGRNRWGSG